MEDVRCEMQIVDYATSLRYVCSKPATRFVLAQVFGPMAGCDKCVKTRIDGPHAKYYQELSRQEWTVLKVLLS